MVCRLNPDKHFITFIVFGRVPGSSGLQQPLSLTIVINFYLPLIFNVNMEKLKNFNKFKIFQKLKLKLKINYSEWFRVNLDSTSKMHFFTISMAVPLCNFGGKMF